MKQVNSVLVNREEQAAPVSDPLLEIAVLFEIDIPKDGAAGRDVDCRVEFAQLERPFCADNNKQCFADLGLVDRLASAQDLRIGFFNRLGEFRDHRVNAPRRLLDYVSLKIVEHEMHPEVGAMWNPSHSLADVVFQRCRELLLPSQLRDPALDDSVDFASNGLAFVLSTEANCRDLGLKLS